MKHILYIHGYNGSPTGGSYTLFDELLDKSKYELHTIDYNAEDPEGAVTKIRKYVKENKIQLVIGSSLGGFLTPTVSLSLMPPPSSIGIEMASRIFLIVSLLDALASLAPSKSTT